jgi:hypothetical protein
MPQIPHMSRSLGAGCAASPEGGIAPAPRRTDSLWAASSSHPAALNLDPNTHAFVAATAAITSIAFTVSVLNVLAVILSHLVAG